MPADEEGGPARRGATERVGRPVVDEADERSALPDLEQRPGEEREDRRRLPAVHHAGADQEDGRERDVAGRKALERNRKRLGERGGAEQGEDAEDRPAGRARVAEPAQGHPEHGRARHHDRREQRKKPEDRAFDAFLRPRPIPVALERACGSFSHGESSYV